MHKPEIWWFVFAGAAFSWSMPVVKSKEDLKANWPCKELSDQVLKCQTTAQIQQTVTSNKQKQLQQLPREDRIRLCKPEIDAYKKCITHHRKSQK